MSADRCACGKERHETTFAESTIALLRLPAWRERGHPARTAFSGSRQ